MTRARMIRREDRLDDAAEVVRGGTLAEAVLRIDAERYFEVYGVFGISVFAVRGASLDQLLSRGPLDRFAIVSVISARVLLAHGLALVATGRNPRHFTVRFDDLEEGMDALMACDHVTVRNPYHQEDEPWR